jgi:hypothetical protein
VSWLSRRKRHLVLVEPATDWPALTAALLNRCQGLCEACGLPLPADESAWDRHHRQSRRFGDNSISNLVALHSQCHVISRGSVHQRVSWAKDMGLIVPSWQRPETASMWLPDGRLVYLTKFGLYHVIQEANEDAGLDFDRW